MLRKKGLPSKAFMGVGVALLMITALTVGGYLTTLHDNMGPLTALHPNNQMLGGYSSHAEFEQDCTHCHGPIHCIISESCQDCHIDVATERAEAIGLHGLLPGTGSCQSCHTEHRGRDAQITVFAFNNIDHTLLASYSLDTHQTDYAGRPLTCESCHRLGQFGPENLDCATCHINHAPDYMAEHDALYGPDCLACHNGHDQLANFDHNQSYILTGAHNNAACEACHIDQLYAGTPQACEACHEEPDLHAGQFGLDCGRCHSDTAWSPAELTQHNFPLDHGSDGRQPCESCHVNSYAEYPCEICHDYAEMQTAHTDTGDVALNNCLYCHPTGLVQPTGVISSN